MQAESRVLAPDEPGRRLRLASHAYIRLALRTAMPGVRVSQEAVEATAKELETHLEVLIARARGRYDRELRARRVHGLYPRGWLRGYHIEENFLPMPPEEVPDASPEII